MALLSKRSEYVTNPIEEEDAVAEMLMKHGKKIIKLSRGDPAAYFKTPKYTIKAYIKALKEGRTGYSNSLGSTELRQAIVKRYEKLYNVHATPDDIIVTQGVTEALMFINSMFINPGDKALMFRPYYPMYMPNLRTYGGKPILENYEERLGWNIDSDSLERRLKKDVKDNKNRIKYMMVTNPNNPTGAVLDKGSLEEIVDLANEYNLFLISDEIYDELIFNKAKFTSVSKLAKGIPHMILNGASKDYDATGFRIGYMMIPEHDAVSKEVKAKLADYARARLSANTPAQYAAAEAISNFKQHSKEVKKMVKQLEGRVNFATKLINKSQYMQAVIPKGAFYIFPKVEMNMLKFKNDADLVDRFLREEDIQITRGSGFGAEGYIRIVALAPKSILEFAIDKLNSFCERNAR